MSNAAAQTSESRTLSVVIPVFNEVRTLRTIIDRVLAANAAGLQKELVIVDDGSTDGSRDLLRQIEAEGGYGGVVKVYFQPKNLGKGAALRRGFEESAGDFVVVQDADLEYDPNDWDNLLPPLLDGRADVVYGSRFLGGPHRVHLFWHYVANLGLTMLSNAVTNLNLTDMETCYKVFRRDVLQQITLEENRFGFEPEITAKVARMGARIYEAPISYSGRDYSEGKKIGFKDGVRALYCITKYGLLRR